MFIEIINNELFQFGSIKFLQFTLLYFKGMVEKEFFVLHEEVIRFNDFCLEHTEYATSFPQPYLCFMLSNCSFIPELCVVSPEAFVGFS